ncbi:TIGR01459 family HAD-type hydrolase [Microbaculum sp. FT89]|uniref:TIGR01459 family HAD-type hydrolase n=1 Tax=Microbaculum sp. FT89 TaxID=3447298 RepID=UPI003F538C09
MSDTSPANGPHPQILLRFRDLAERYDGILCDIWGVVHNGVRAWPDACDALHRFREAGGRVVLITNAPRPSAPIREMLDGLKVPHHAYDDIVSSGDLTHAMLAERAGRKAFHLGPERDLGVFEGIDMPLTGAADAELVVNTGLFDDTTETPDDYADMLAAFRARDVEMVCANPDVVVERGDELLYCAGALADAYEALGGRVLWAGKPHPPIYDEALARLATAAGRPVERARVLAIGDSLRTDLAGAARSGVDALFIASGIHGGELIREDALDLPGLEQSFRQADVWPRAVMSRLVW